MHKVNPIKEEWGRLQRDNDLEKANEAINDNKVVQDTFKVASDTYTLAQDYKHTCDLMIMKWCTWYGAMQNVMMQCHQILVDWAKMHDTRNNTWMTWSNSKSPNLWARSSQSM
jgi:Flp pilus assembly CpaE family ATPase